MDPSEPWLKRWHDRKAGATSRSFLRAKPSSYEWLAARAAPGDRVLDLACGDGPLLKLLRDRGVDDVVGIDMSEGELSAARERLGPDVPLVQGRAQALPFEDGSFDRVTCHLALMLMRPIEPVIAEIRRVLRPGGELAAVMGGGGAAPEANAWSLLGQRLRQEPFHGPAIGDKRAYSEEGLREILGGFAEVHVERMLLDLSGTPDEIIALLHETYDVERMEPERVAALEVAVRGDFEAIVRPDGTVPCWFGAMGVWASVSG